MTPREFDAALAEIATTTPYAMEDVRHCASRLLARMPVTNRPAPTLAAAITATRLVADACTAFDLGTLRRALRLMYGDE